MYTHLFNPVSPPGIGKVEDCCCIDATEAILTSIDSLSLISCVVDGCSCNFERVDRQTEKEKRWETTC